MRVLVVEDDPRLQRLLQRTLREEGFAVDVVGDGEDGLHLAASEPYDAVVLDILLPGLSGIEVLRRLRRRAVATPVLVLSARDTADDRVLGLDEGADDYLVKPFEVRELLARVRALVRRQHRVPSNVIEVGALRIDLQGRSVTRDGCPVELRAKEFAVLELLALRRGQVVSRSEIHDHVWGHDNDTLSNTVDVHVCRLRSQLQGDGPPLIETRRGQGYVFGREDG